MTLRRVGLKGVLVLTIVGITECWPQGVSALRSVSITRNVGIEGRRHCGVSALRSVGINGVLALRSGGIIEGWH